MKLYKLEKEDQYAILMPTTEVNKILNNSNKQVVYILKNDGIYVTGEFINKSYFLYKLVDQSKEVVTDKKEIKKFLDSKIISISDLVKELVDKKLK